MKDSTLYGIHALEEALKEEQPINRVWLLQNSRNPGVNKLVALLNQKKVAFSFVPKERFERYKQHNHQGVVAQLSPVQTEDAEALINRVLQETEKPLFLLLDGITDARNFGAILRSAAAAGAHGVFLPSSGSAPLNGDTIKTSAGAIFKIPIAKVNHPKDALFLFDAYGITSIGITEKTDAFLYSIELNAPIALVLGDEHKGISKGVLTLLKEQAQLPMAAGIDSLNVAVACAIALYEAVRQRL
jgi:23S rRNA (guanosine2251-2'-O)-methyltransferase